MTVNCFISSSTCVCMVFAVRCSSAPIWKQAKEPSFDANVMGHLCVKHAKTCARQLAAAET
jgi:hypothetical protein